MAAKDLKDRNAKRAKEIVAAVAEYLTRACERGSYDRLTLELVSLDGEIQRPKIMQSVHID